MAVVRSIREPVVLHAVLSLLLLSVCADNDNGGDGWSGNSNSNNWWYSSIYTPQYSIQIMNGSSTVSYDPSKPLTLSIVNITLQNTNGWKYSNANLSYDVLFKFTVMGSAGFIQLLPNQYSFSAITGTVPVSVTLPAQNFSSDRVLLIDVTVTAKLANVQATSLSNGLVKYGSVTFSGSSQNLVISQNSSVNCLVSPWNGYSYTTFRFICTGSFASSSPRMSIWLKNQMSTWSVVSYYSGNSFSSVLPSGTWTPYFKVANSSTSWRQAAQINISATLIVSDYSSPAVNNNSTSSNGTSSGNNNSSSSGNATQSCPFAALDAILNSSGDVNQASIALDLLSSMVGNDSEVEKLSALCNITNLSSWRTNNRRKWMSALRNINYYFGNQVDMKKQIQSLRALADANVTKADNASDAVNPSAIDSLSSVVDTLRSLQSAMNYSDLDDNIQQTVPVFSNIWDSSSNSNCSDESLSAQITLLGNLISLSNSYSLSVSDSSITAKWNLLSGSGTLASFGTSLVVKIPREAVEKCWTNNTALQIISTDFISKCRQEKNSSVHTPSFTVKLYDIGQAAECIVEKLQESIVLEIDVSSSASSTSELVCAWYDGSSQSWSTEGCVTEALQSAIRCNCTHLTEFALMLRAKEMSSSIDFVEYFSRSKSVPVLSAVIFSFGCVLMLLCWQLYNIKNAGHMMDNLAVLLPVHAIMLFIAADEVVFAVLQLKASALSSLSLIGAVQLICVLTMIPILAFFAVTGLCIISWMQIYHVNMKNSLTDESFRRFRTYFYCISLLVGVVATSLMILAAYVRIEVALKIYQAMMLSCAGTCMVLSVMFFIYGSKLHSQITAIHRRLAGIGGHGLAFKQSKKLEAAVRTQIAGIVFCISTFIMSLTWFAYGLLLKANADNITMFATISVVRHASELASLLTCLWLYKFAIPTRGQDSSKDSSLNRAGSVFRRSIVEVKKRMRSGSDPAPPSFVADESGLVRIPQPENVSKPPAITLSTWSSMEASSVPQNSNNSAL